MIQIHIIEAIPFRLILFFLLLCLAGWLIIRRLNDRNRRFLGRVFWSAFSLRLAFALFVLLIVPLFVAEGHFAHGFYGNDGAFYDAAVLRWLSIINAGKDFLHSPPYPRSIAYLSLYALVYKTVGHQMLAMPVLNAFFGSLVVLIVYYIAIEFLPERYAKLSAVLTAIYPSQIMFSGSHLKEIFVTVLFLAGVWAIIKYPGTKDSRKRVKLALIVLACSGLLVLTRIAYVLPLLFAVVWPRDFHHWRTLLRRLLLVIVTVIIIIVARVIVVSWSSPAAVLSRLQNPAWIKATLSQLFYSQYMKPTTSNSFLRLVQPPYHIIFLPLTITFIVLQPYLLGPFMLPYPGCWIPFPATVVWYMLIPFTLYGFFAPRRHLVARQLFVITSVVFLVLAITGSGVPHGARLRSALQPILLIYAAIGIIAFSEGNIKVRLTVAGYIFVIGSGVALYLFVKGYPTLSLFVLPLTILLSAFLSIYWIRTYRRKAK